MEEFRFLSLPEFFEIRSDELQILDRLRSPPSVFDEHGDVAFDEKGQPLIDTSIPMNPKELIIPETNRFASVINGSGVLDVVPTDLIEGYGDVFSIDDQMADVASGTDRPFSSYKGYHARVIGYFVGGVYQGSVWAFTSDDWSGFLGLYGIRTSMANALLGVRGVARKIFEMVIGGGIEGVRTIIVPWPLHPIPSLLLRLGFIHHNDPSEREVAERNFLLPIASTSDYYTYTL